MGRPVARIDGGAGHLEVAVDRSAWARNDFSLSMWVNAASAADTSTLGDLASSFDPAERRGFTLGFQHGAVCGSHRNDRNLFFGLDAGTEPRWQDYGQPADDVVMIYALVTHDDRLYAATWEESSTRRHAATSTASTATAWVDCGSPGTATR